jgi:methionine-rich copper-binding protein CopC
LVESFNYPITKLPNYAHFMKTRLLLTTLISLLAFAGRAAAHAELRSAVPAPGESLSQQPEELRLTFSEAVGPGSTITLFGEGFREVEGLEARVDEEQEDVLVTAVPHLTAGTYSVNWTVLSLDGHPAAGSYTFAVLPEAERTTPAYLWPALTIAALALGLGSLWLRRKLNG